MDTSRVREEDCPVETPKWLDILENRKKRPHRLAHDIGAGSPCLVCKEKCKGLNLHFWRKICMECKCRKEDHDFVDEDNYVQFEILFGAKKVNKTTLNLNAQNRTFDWVPQNVSKELVMDYMNALPQSKLPITNTEGAAYRKQQLEKQLPVYDVNPEACHNLTDKEIIEFQKYLQNLKNSVIGQGKIMKFQNFGISKDAPLSTIVPSGRADTTKVPYNTRNEGVFVRDKNVEAKTVFSEKINSQSYGAESSPITDVMRRNEANLIREPTSDNENNNTVAALVRDNYCQRLGQMNINDSQQNLDNLPVYPTPTHPNGVDKEVMGLNRDKGSSTLQRDQLNVMNASSYDLPYTPLQESYNMSKKRDVTKADPSAPQNPPIMKEGKLTGNVAGKCVHCKQMFEGNDVVVSTERGGDSALWHAKCFVCDLCQELLVDLMYFYHEGKVYCGRDYAKIRNIPRCSACDELIFVKEYTQAEEQFYHLRHFCCYFCDEPLGGKQYIPKDNQPICLECYQNHYGKTCSTCMKPIPVSDQRVSIGEHHFHLDPQCFRCVTCSKNLKGQRFKFQNGKTFCSKECFINYQ